MLSSRNNVGTPVGLWCYDECAIRLPSKCGHGRFNIAGAMDIRGDRLDRERGGDIFECRSNRMFPAGAPCPDLP